MNERKRKIELENRMNRAILQSLLQSYMEFIARSVSDLLSPYCSQPFIKLPTYANSHILGASALRYILVADGQYTRK